MRKDISAVLWKEFRELLVHFGGNRGRTGLIIFTAVFGILMPLQGGRAWLETPVALASWAWLPFLIVSGVVADSIAGERDRHTLETMLATRLHATAILAGKLIAAVLYGCIQIWIISLLSALTVNLAYFSGGVSFYSLSMTAGIIIFPLLVAFLSASIAALVSIRAETARSAQQTMSIAIIILFLPLFALNFLPESMLTAVGGFLETIDSLTAALALGAFLSAAAVLAFLAAAAKFTRYRLVR